MDHYFVSTKVTIKGVHTVHKDGCMYMPNVTQRNYLGLFLTAKEAVKVACHNFQNAKACNHCLEEVYASISADYE